MLISDPIGDMLTRLRNAIKARKKYVVMPSTKFKVNLAEVLKRNGYIESYDVIDEGNNKKSLRVNLRFVNGVSAITGLERVSTPGIHVYKGAKELPRVKNGLGIVVVSTSSGVMSDQEARMKNVGGEILCKIW
ncbi:MAG TPA: 30S ribosomal protein S8 [Ignavibacteriales bacterium]|jgi:small subunit ribosomal protein S8|nr:30S ribosomal protein S8 [Ignavibacteriales bacterium]